MLTGNPPLTDRYGDLAASDYAVLRSVVAAEGVPGSELLMFDAGRFPGVEIVMIPQGGATFTATVGRWVSAPLGNGLAATAAFIPTQQVTSTALPAFRYMNGVAKVGVQITLLSGGSVIVLARGLGRGRVRATSRPMPVEAYSGLSALVPDMTIANAELYTVVGAGASIVDVADGLQFTVPAGAAGDDPDLIAFASWRMRDQRGSEVRYSAGFTSPTTPTTTPNLAAMLIEKAQSSIADIGVVIGISNVANIASAACYSVFWRAHRTSTNRVAGVGRMFAGVVSGVTNDASPINTPRIWHCTHSDLQASTVGTMQMIGLTATGQTLSFDSGIVGAMNVGFLDVNPMFVYVAAYRSALTAAPGTQTFKPRYIVRNPQSLWT